MQFKKLALISFAMTFLFAASANAKAIKANQCTLAILPFGLTMSIESERDAIINAYTKKGYYVSAVTSLEAASAFEFYADASLDCSITYFGAASSTTLRLVNFQTSTIVSRIKTPLVMDLFQCKNEILKAIAELPNCSIR